MAAFGASLTASVADAATPLASAQATVNRPALYSLSDSLLRLCITSHTLDPSGTCLTVGSPAPAVTGTMSGVLDFNELSEAGVGLYFSGLGAPSLGTGFAGFPYSSAAVTSVRTPESFPYQPSDGTGTCVTRGSGTGTALAGVNYLRLPVDPVTPPSDVAITVPMWGQLECHGAFAGHTGPFNIDFAGTATFHQSIFDPCCPFADLQGGWVVAFGS